MALVMPKLSRLPYVNDRIGFWYLESPEPRSCSLLESISTGTHLLSTIDTNDAFKIHKESFSYVPECRKTDNEVLLISIYEAIDLGIHVESEITSKGITRKITQIVAFDSVDHQPNITLLFDIHQKIALFISL